ncbi:MAG TPA: HD domain-containing protein [Candidatus Nanoarchaeia archaeon]|nr:HD domain-containing protein [Candidatus Nanoarchaeia archaeon]
MKKSQIIKNTELFAKQSLEKDKSGSHDWWHIVRVRNNGRAICKTEKADPFIVDLAVLLHDVGDWKVIDKKEDDYTIAENFLVQQNLDQKTIDQVMFIIKNMSFSKSLGQKSKNVPIEFYVVQDADRLDAMGAIGIARVFAYGGVKGRPLHDPVRKFSKHFSSEEHYRNSAPPSFHHFYEKILLLKDLMNTKSAKKIAARRHEYLKKYMKQFLLEWEGKR